jgi:glycosyltransferase involved in cell wall biosynthesis
MVFKRTWRLPRLRDPMPYRIVDLELEGRLPLVELGAEEDGIGLAGRWDGSVRGFVLLPCAPGSAFKADGLQRIVEERFAQAIVDAKVEQFLRRRWPAAASQAPPSLTIAICTKDRPGRLRRLLGSLSKVLPCSRFGEVAVIVVDNAPADDLTRLAVAEFDFVRYVLEPRVGLDFARNAALRATESDLIAYLDDDVVVDRAWLEGLYRVCMDCPDAGGYTGLVLPFRLDTEAQREFEMAGGFGRGFRRLHHGQAKAGNDLHPLGAGVVGAGCNMCFDRRLLAELGGFDEALDTGAPLPGGGDLDIFHRVMRSGRGIVYEPSYAVWHEHRETLSQLRRQYWSWGLGFMAYLSKCRGEHSIDRERLSNMAGWWFRHQLLSLAGALVRGRGRRASFVGAELWGGVQGYLGEYGRSVERSRRIRERFATVPADAQARTQAGEQ